MKPYDFVHLVIHAANDQVQGRTKLQKLVYFVGALTGTLDQLGFRLRYYGPYSPAVSGAIQELRGLKFLTLHCQSVVPEDNAGFENNEYDYALTEEGKEIAQEKAQEKQELWQAIVKAIELVNQANGSDYVRLALAAKTHLISLNIGCSFSLEGLRDKTFQHGWRAFSDTQFEDALGFLERLGLKPGASELCHN